MALERIVLNIIPDGKMPVFHCSQYENGRPIIIDLVSSDDDAFVVPEGATVELHCRKIDDNIVTIEPNEVDNNTVTFVSTEQLTACPGDNLCEIVLYSDTDPVQTIATLNFILHVEPDPLEGGLTSETQINNLTQQIEDITQQVIGDDYYNKTEVDDLLAGKADQATTYTKSEVDSALALKANTADLATVATTGDYDDLINKPTIPAAQVQSDYAQADNTQIDYIKNKPDINAMINSVIDNIFPTKTASGAVANFTTGLTMNLVNCTVEEGATTITHAGGNFFDKANINENALINGSGNYVSYAGWWVSDYVPVKEGASYYLLGLTTHPNTYQDNFELFDASKTKIGYSNVRTNEYPFIIPNGVKYVRFSGNYSDINTALFGLNASAPYTPYVTITYYPVADKDDIVTLAGENNLFTDSGDITVQYKGV